MIVVTTLVSTNRLMVARMSWWPETSSKVSGLYFSTLEGSEGIRADVRSGVALTMADYPRPLRADWRRFSCLWNRYCWS